MRDLVAYIPPEVSQEETLPIKVTVGVAVAGAVPTKDFGPVNPIGFAHKAHNGEKFDRDLTILARLLKSITLELAEKICPEAARIDKLTKQVKLVDGSRFNHDQLQKLLAAGMLTPMPNNNTYLKWSVPSVSEGELKAWGLSNDDIKHVMNIWRNSVKEKLGIVNLYIDRIFRPLMHAKFWGMSRAIKYIAILSNLALVALGFYIVFSGILPLAIGTGLIASSTLITPILFGSLRIIAECLAGLERIIGVIGEACDGLYIGAVIVKVVGLLRLLLAGIT